MDFEEKLRHGHLEASEFPTVPPVYEAEEGVDSEEEAVEISEEQLLRELDSMEPALQVCTRLFRDLGPSYPALKRLTWCQVEEFRQKGYIVIDNFVGRDVAARVRNEALMLYRQGWFQEASRSGLGSGRDFTDRTARGDHVMWLHPGRPPATSTSLATCLTALQELQADLQAVMALAHRSAEYQLAMYPSNGAQYVRHRDAFPDDGSEEHMRRVTAILYANPGWCPADGGKLRLWPPRTADAAPAGGASVAGYSPRASTGHEGAHSNGDRGTLPYQHAAAAHGHHHNGELSPAQNGHARSGASQDLADDASSPGPVGNGHAEGFRTSLHHCLTNGLGNALANGHLSGHGDDKGSARLSSSEQGRPPYSDPDSDSASYRSSEGAPYARGEGSPCLRLDAMQPQVLPGGPGAASRGAYFGHSSVASSVVAEATEASLLDSLQDGVSSLDEGSLDGHGSREREGLGIKRTEVGAEPVVDVAPMAGRLVMFLSGAVEHAVLPNLAQRVALTAWCQ